MKKILFCLIIGGLSMSSQGHACDDSPAGKRIMEAARINNVAISDLELPTHKQLVPVAVETVRFFTGNTKVRYYVADIKLGGKDFTCWAKVKHTSENTWFAGVSNCQLGDVFDSVGNTILIPMTQVH